MLEMRAVSDPNQQSRVPTELLGCTMDGTIQDAVVELLLGGQGLVRWVLFAGAKREQHTPVCC